MLQWDEVYGLIGKMKIHRDHIDLNFDTTKFVG